MDAAPADIERFREALAETPRRIAAATTGLDEARLQFKPDADTWSVNEILAHLRACADVWGKSIMAMLAQDNPTLAHVSPRTWIRKTHYPQLAFAESFAAYVKQREALLATLKHLSPADWSHVATIQGRQHSVFTQVRRMALHENEHCEQIEAMLK